MGKQAAALQVAMPWLKPEAAAVMYEVPTFSVEDRACDIFYREWILYPSNSGVSPGYLDVVPAMNAATSQTSVLRLAIEAFAMANIQHFTISDGNLRDKAWATYGKALAAVRRSISENGHITSDHLLLAILMIDMFEVVFTVRRDSLGHHSGAVEYMLAARRKTNVTSSHGYSIYRMAQHRVQSRQLRLSLDPLPVQLECIDMLNHKDSSLNLSRILLKEQPLLHAAQELLDSNDEKPAAIQEQCSTLMTQIRSVLDELRDWSNHVPSSWAPQHLQVAEHDHVRRFFEETSLPLIDQVRVYYDAWVAYQINFLHQGQLALHSAIIDLLQQTSDSTARVQPTNDLAEQVLENETAIKQYADEILESIPMLMGCKGLDAADGDFHSFKKVGWCFAQGACWALQGVKHLPPEKRLFADTALSWMQSLDHRHAFT